MNKPKCDCETDAQLRSCRAICDNDSMHKATEFKPDWKYIKQRFHNAEWCVDYGDQDVNPEQHEVVLLWLERRQFSRGFLISIYEKQIIGHPDPIRNNDEIVALIEHAVAIEKMTDSVQLRKFGFDKLNYYFYINN